MSMSSRQPKQSMSELKLRRVTEHIQRLRDDLARPRIRVSEASLSLIRYTRQTKDPLVRSFPFSAAPTSGSLFFKSAANGLGSPTKTRRSVLPTANTGLLVRGDLVLARLVFRHLEKLKYNTHSYIAAPFFPIRRSYRSLFYYYYPSPMRHLVGVDFCFTYCFFLRSLSTHLLIWKIRAM